METKKKTENEVILWHYSLCCDAIIGPSYQHFDNTVNKKVEIHISMQYLFYQAIFILPFVSPLQSNL